MSNHSREQETKTGPPPADPLYSQSLAIDSQRGHRLKLTYVGDSVPVLDRIDFYQAGQTESNFLDRTHNTYPLRWTKVTKALTLLFLEYAAWGKAGSVGKCHFSGKYRGSLAASLGDAICKGDDDEFIHTLFAYGDTKSGLASLVKKIFVCDKANNVHGKSKDKRDRRIVVNVDTLPPKNVYVIWNTETSAGNQHIAGLHEIRTLVDRFRKLLGEPPKRWPAMPGATVLKKQSGLINEKDYASTLSHRFNHVPLENFDVAGGQYQDLSFFRLYIPQTVRGCKEFLPRTLEAKNFHTRHRSDRPESGAEKQLLERYARQDQRSVVEVVDNLKVQCVVILGSLGSGKSSLLRFLMLRWANTRRTGRLPKAIPILIELRQYAEYAQIRRANGERDTFVDFLHQGTGAIYRFPKNKLTNFLTSGRVHVFFDGLDEVLNLNLRREIEDNIFTFAAEYPNVRIVITSRLIGYRGDLFRQGGFDHYLLQDFQEDQIFEFIDKWHSEVTRITRTQQVKNSERLKLLIGESATIRELAGNPFLLTLMVVPESPENPPTHRLDLLERYAIMLLEHWKVDQALRSDPDLAADATALGIREKKQILRHIARHISVNSRHVANTISEEALETNTTNVIKDFVKSNPRAVSRAMIRHLRERNGILCKVGGDQYGFVHRAFLDFYTADDLREQFVSGQTSIADLMSFFKLHWLDEDWRETFRLFSAMVEPQLIGAILSDLLKIEICNHDFILFGAECLKDVKGRNQIIPLFQCVKKRLLEIAKYDPPKAELFPQYPVGTTRDQENYCNDQLVVAWQFEYSEKCGVATLAVEMLGSLFAGADDLFEPLQILGEEINEFTSVQAASVMAIGQYWRDNPRTRGWLEKIAQNASAGRVREAALKSLSRPWFKNPSVLNFLKNRSQLDKDIFVQETAIREIAKTWKNDRLVLNWLKRQVMDSKTPSIPSIAIQEIEQNFHANKSLSLWLKKARKREEGKRQRALLKASQISHYYLPPCQPLNKNEDGSPLY